jgi:hypothetical protein
MSKYDTVGISYIWRRIPIPPIWGYLKRSKRFLCMHKLLHSGVITKTIVLLKHSGHNRSQKIHHYLCMPRKFTLITLQHHSIVKSSITYILSYIWRCRISSIILRPFKSSNLNFSIFYKDFWIQAIVVTGTSYIADYAYILVDSLTCLGNAVLLFGRSRMVKHPQNVSG